MSDRDALIASVAAGWDDPLPVLVVADWAEDHGCDDPALLRWYAREVMPALAGVAVEPAGGASPWAVGTTRRRECNRLRRHPQAATLVRLANTAVCRLPGVWEGLTPSGHDLLTTNRLLALGLVTTDDLRRATARVKGQIRDECRRVFGGRARAVANASSSETLVFEVPFDHYLASLPVKAAEARVMPQGMMNIYPGLCGRHQLSDYQLGLFRALADVPSLPGDRGSDG